MRFAISTPRAMMGNEVLIRISSSAAMSAPVQPPVPGSGTATKSSRPQLRQRLTYSLWRIERTSSFSTIFLVPLKRLRNWKILRIKSRINGIGRILPI